MKTASVQVRATSDGLYYYRIVAANGECLCISESYTRERDAWRGVVALFRAMAGMMTSVGVDAEEIVQYLVGKAPFIPNDPTEVEEPDEEEEDEREIPLEMDRSENPSIRSEFLDSCVIERGTSKGYVRLVSVDTGEKRDIAIRPDGPTPGVGKGDWRVIEHPVYDHTQHYNGEDPSARGRD